MSDKYFNFLETPWHAFVEKARSRVGKLASPVQLGENLLNESGVQSSVWMGRTRSRLCVPSIQLFQRTSGQSDLRQIIPKCCWWLKSGGGIAELLSLRQRLRCSDHSVLSTSDGSTASGEQRLYCRLLAIPPQSMILGGWMIGIGIRIHPQCTHVSDSCRR